MFCHEVVNMYLDNFDTYANFEFKELIWIFVVWTIVGIMVEYPLVALLHNIIVEFVLLWPIK